MHGLCCLTGTIEVDQCLNDAIYGEGSSPADILDGKVLLSQHCQLLTSLRGCVDSVNRSAGLLALPAEGAVSRRSQS
jgi:hypothetical protein